jgi:hypothetical protein
MRDSVIWWITRRYTSLTEDLVKASENQIRLQGQALRADLYERRLKVFLGVVQFLAGFAAVMKVEWGDLHTLLRETLEAEFLFGPEVTAFIADVYFKASEYRVRSKLAEDPREERRRPKLIEEQTSLGNWLASDAMSRAKELFAAYLELSEQNFEALVNGQHGSKSA